MVETNANFRKRSSTLVKSPKMGSYTPQYCFSTGVYSNCCRQDCHQSITYLLTVQILESSNNKLIFSFFVVPFPSFFSEGYQFLEFDMNYSSVYFFQFHHNTQNHPKDTIWPYRLKRFWACPFLVQMGLLEYLYFL